MSVNYESAKRPKYDPSKCNLESQSLYNKNLHGNGNWDFLEEYIRNEFLNSFNRMNE